MSRGRPLRDVSQFGVTIPGFSIWWDRWTPANGWCWRELPNSPFRHSVDDVTRGCGYRSKMAARAAVREEIMRRQGKTATARVR